MATTNEIDMELYAGIDLHCNNSVVSVLEPIGYIPPAEAEAHYYRQLANQAATTG